MSGWAGRGGRVVAVLPWLTDEQADPGKMDECGDGVMDGLGAARVAGQLQGAKGLAHKMLRCGWWGNRAAMCRERAGLIHASPSLS